MELNHLSRGSLHVTTGVAEGVDFVVDIDAELNVTEGPSSVVYGHALYGEVVDVASE